MMVEYIQNSAESDSGVCSEIATNHKGLVEDLLDEQDEYGGESWTLLLDTGNGVRTTNIRVGGESEVDDGDIEDAIDDYTFSGIDRVVFVHTHPSSGFLSPADISAHARFVRSFDQYEATVGVFEEGGEVEIFSAENDGDITINEQAEINKEMEKFNRQLRDIDDPGLFYDKVSDLFSTMDEYVDFCRASYTRE